MKKNYGKSIRSKPSHQALWAFLASQRFCCSWPSLSFHSGMVLVVYFVILYGKYSNTVFLICHFCNVVMPKKKRNKQPNKKPKPDYIPGFTKGAPKKERERRGK